MANPVAPNFVNPAYASPEQIKAQREYAAQLLGNTNEPVVSKWQGAANIARALMGGLSAHQADVQEQQSNKAFNDQFLKAFQNPGDLASQAALAANPRATPFQAYLISELNKPQGQVTLSGEPSISRPGPNIQQMRGTPPPQGNAPMPPQAANPNDVPTGTPMPPGQNITGPNTTVNSVQTQNLPPGGGPIDPADLATITKLQEIKKQQLRENAAATAAGQADVREQGTEAVTADIAANLRNDIPDLLNYIDKNPTATVGKAAWLTKDVPNSPAAIAQEKLRKIRAGVLQQEVQTIENRDQRRMSPDEIAAISDKYGLTQNQPIEDLRANLSTLLKKFTGGTNSRPATPANLTPKPGQAQAGERSGGGPAFNVLKVHPPGQYNAEQ